MPRARKNPQYVDVAPPPDFVPNTPAAPESTPAPRPVSPDPSSPEPSAPSRPPTRPVPDSELTADQRRIKELEDLLAKERGRKDVEPEFVEVPQEAAETGETIRIHFLEDGLTALGRIWYRGEELEIVPGSREYADTCDRNGRSWLELRHDEFAQIDRWGHVKFRSGPWRGKTLADAAEEVSFEPLISEKGQRVPPPTVAELQQAEKLRARRGAPRLPAL